MSDLSSWQLFSRHADLTCALWIYSSTCGERCNYAYVQFGPRSDSIANVDDAKVPACLLVDRQSVAFFGDLWRTAICVPKDGGLAVGGQCKCRRCQLACRNWRISWATHYSHKACVHAFSSFSSTKVSSSSFFCYFCCFPFKSRYVCTLLA